MLYVELNKIQNIPTVQDGGGISDWSISLGDEHGKNGWGKIGNEGVPKIHVKDGKLIVIKKQSGYRIKTLREVCGQLKKSRSIRLSILRN